MSFTGTSRLSQRAVYELLHTRGSPWLKAHVVFADRSVMVLNKPPNVVCQLDRSATDSENEPTSLNGVFRDIKHCFSFAHPYPIHRLDKPTTGCLIIPLNISVANALSEQLEKSEVHKTYLALVRGGRLSFSGTSGRITAPLAYANGRGMISPDGTPSITDWELVASSTTAPVSLLRLDLITGQKHQLRIHLAKFLNAPILGDSLHSTTPLTPSIVSATEVPKNRLFLHAAEVSFFRFRLMGRRYRLAIRAPLPPDFYKICQDLGIDVPHEQLEGGLWMNDIIKPGGAKLQLWNPLDWAQ